MITDENGKVTVDDKVVMEFGHHGHVCYVEAYVLMRYTEKGLMEPFAFTGDKEFAEAYISGDIDFPEDGVGVIKILSLPMDLEQ